MKGKVRIMDNNMNANMMGAMAPQYDNNGYNNYGRQVVHTNITPVNCDEAMQITTLSDLQSYAAGTVIRFPDFAEGQPFVARTKRPSLLVLAKSGKIPNSLLTTAGELFAGGNKALDTDNENMLGDMYEIIRIIAESSLIQPSLADIESAGLELTDEQLMAIFNYCQAGVKALESFRKE